MGLMPSVLLINTFVADKIMFVAITAKNLTPMPPAEYATTSRYGI